MKISVVIPAYNEEGVILNTLNKYQMYLKSNFEEHEIIAVNDGSTDNTLKEIKKSDVTVISYAKNQGKGYAVKRGMLRATGDYVFFTDADCSYSPQNITRALIVMQKTGASGVSGVRLKKNKEYPWYRILMSKILLILVRHTISNEIQDSQCGFKGFEKKTARQIFSCTQILDFGFDFEVFYLFKIFGKKIAAVPINFVHRKKSKVNLATDSIKIVKNVLKIRQRKALWEHEQPKYTH
jgi:dolichyl-phosphate beta-glucosyltransferase